MKQRSLSHGRFIPGPDAAFHASQADFVTYASASLVALGLVAGDMNGDSVVIQLFVNKLLAGGTCP